MPGVRCLSIMKRQTIFKASLYLALVLLIGAIIFVALMISKGHQRKVSYSRVKRGDSRDTVVALLGQPDEIKQGGENIWWDSEFLKKNTGECVEEYWYNSPFTIEQWAIGFDKHGSVIHKYHYASP